MKTILIAEHHRPTLEHLIAALTQAGYKVEGVPDASTAMEHFVAGHPDAVLIAVDFPRVDGAHFGQAVRANDRGARLPMLAIDKGHLGRARGVGAILEMKANGYVADPLKFGELTSKLASLLQTIAPPTPETEGGLHRTLSRPPVVSGELKGAPLPALVHSFYRLHRDGVLIVAYRDLTRRVFFLKGKALHYDSNARQDAFARWLVEKGDLSEKQADQMTAALQGGMRVGAALADAGTELAGEDLLHKLSEYTREKAAQAIGMREGRYAFFAGEEFKGHLAQVELPALSIILDGARRTFPLKLFAQALKAHLGEFPRRSAAFAQDLPALGLDRQDLKLAMQMNGRIPLRELIAHGRGDLHQAYSLLWFLKLTGTVSFTKEPVASADPGISVGPDSIAPRKKKPLPREQLDELREAAVKIITGSYFRVLGLDITADTEAVERAYHEVATRFHPDSYPEADTSEIKDLLDSVQDKLSASYRVLSSEHKRRAYVQYLFGKLDVSRVAGVNVDAEIVLKRGEAALKRGDLTTALRAFEEAVSINPREPEYYSYLAWATYKARGGDKKERARNAQKILKKALSINPTLERALVISSIIESETGDASTARKRLLKVLEMNPTSKIARAALLKVGR